MRIADSHEFIELYRGDKDVRLGIEMLRLREDLTFTSFAPDRMSPTDRARFGCRMMAEGPIPQLSPRFDLRLLPSRSIRFARRESGGIMSWMPSYGRELALSRPDVIFENPFSWLTPRSYQTYAVSRWTRTPVVYYDPGDDIPVNLRQRTLVPFERGVIQAAKRIITYNEAGRARFVTKYGCDPDRIVVIPKPVDVAQFANPPGAVELRERLCGGDSDTVLVGYVGRLARYKGSAVLREVARAAVEDPSLSGLHFVFIGGALASTESEEDYALPNTTVTGMVARSEIPAHIAACDVLVFPDVTHPGGFPTAVAEAMAAGATLVVGTGGGRHSPFMPLEDGHNAMLVEAGSPHAIADALRHILESREWARSLGRAVGRHARLNMDYPVVAGRYLGIADEVLDEARVGRT